MAPFRSRRELLGKIEAYQRQLAGLSQVQGKPPHPPPYWFSIGYSLWGSDMPYPLNGTHTLLASPS